MANTGLLVLTNPAKVAKLLPAIKKHVSKTLYIQYFPERNVLISGTYPLTPQRWKGPKYSQVIANIYRIASSIKSCLDVRVLLSTLKNPTSIIHTKRPVELVIFDRTYSNNDANTFMQDCLSNTSMGCKFITFDDHKDDGDNTEIQDDVNEGKIYKNVVLGGTFDRLHEGHKILLSEAILRCNEKLTIGICDENMITGKILWELIEPTKTRIETVKDFTNDVDPSIEYDIIPISDMYGPTKSDPSIEMIVVSEETKRGGDKVNERRIEKNFKPLDLHVVVLAEDMMRSDHEDPKISSSNTRMRLLGTRLKEPNMQGKPARPYIIGLTGGIASGKSSIADKLEKLGAGLVDCDKVAHELYEPGMSCYNLIVEHFGSDIVADGVLNRKVLGEIVFNDKEQLQKLNKLVWPAILTETKKRVEELYKKGFEVIVIEAAVLIQAGWQPHCHEIWTCIIPEVEAVRRVIERNKITEEAAKMRIKVQPSNAEQINEANIVVSTLWSHDVTQQQVERAWNELKSDFAKRS